jgi:hypothetical protein
VAAGRPAAAEETGKRQVQVGTTAPKSKAEKRRKKRNRDKKDDKKGIRRSDNAKRRREIRGTLRRRLHEERQEGRPYLVANPDLPQEAPPLRLRPRVEEVGPESPSTETLSADPRSPRTIVGDQSPSCSEGYLTTDAEDELSEAPTDLGQEDHLEPKPKKKASPASSSRRLEPQSKASASSSSKA